MMPWLLILLLFLAGAGGAQTRSKSAASRQKPAAKPSTSSNKWPIESVVVEGNKSLNTDKIVAVAGLKRGQLAGKEDFDAARDRLIASGMFDTVGYKFEPAPNSRGYVATFQVEETGPLYPVRFEGMPALASEIDAYLKTRDPLYGPKLPGTSAVLDSYARQVEVYLASQNHPDKVVGKVIAIAPEKFDIVFRLARGLPVVSEVAFEGNKAVPSTALQHAISSVAYGVQYTEDGFRQLLDTQIRPLYDAQGLVRVSFPKITTEPSSKVKGLDVHVTIDEGPQPYKLGKVSVAGTDENASLLKTAKIKTGGTVNFDEVNQGADRVKKQLRRDGYLNAEITVSRNIDDKNKNIEVVIKADPGPRFVFGKLTIEGLDLHGDAAIKKMWGSREGRPFDVEFPDYFLARVKEDGLFDYLGETKALNHVDDEKHVVDVTLRFEATPPADPKKRRGNPGL